jgi:hypothetical protein
MGRWSKPFELLAQALTIFGVAYGAFALNDWVGRFFFVLGGLVFTWFAIEFYRSYTEEVSPQRIGITELRDKAVKRGWNFVDPSLEIADFANALRQAGRDGTLKFWGRPKTSQFDDVVKDQPLTMLEAQAWRTYQFNYGNLDQVQDNFLVTLYVMSHPDEIRYVDVHVERSEALRWLKRDAGKERGKKKPRGIQRT